MRRQVIAFGVYADKDEKFLLDHLHKAKYEAWERAAEYFDTEIPNARVALESELRGILGGAWCGDAAQVLVRCPVRSVCFSTKQKPAFKMWRCGRYE